MFAPERAELDLNLNFSDVPAYTIVNPVKINCD